MPLFFVADGRVVGRCGGTVWCGVVVVRCCIASRLVLFVV